MADRDENLINSNDEFLGHGGPLFNKDLHDKNGEEEAATYEAIDRRIKERRKKYGKKHHREQSNYRELIHREFSNLKKKLIDVTETEWNDLPEVEETKSFEIKPRFTLPDLTNIPYDNLASMIPALTPTGELDFFKTGQIKRRMLEIKLDEVADSVKGQISIDKDQYLQMLKFNDPLEWIQIAKSKERLGDTETAKNIIMEGCKVNPTSETLWLKAMSLQLDMVKNTIAQSLLCIPTSVKIWKMAALLETDITAKRKIYQEALKHIFSSAELWIAAAELEKFKESSILLNRAVNFCPTSMDLWVKLASLEEVEGNKNIVDEIIQRAICTLRVNNVEIDREYWYKKAMEAERKRMVYLNQIIIKIIVDFRINKENRKSIWIRDINTCLQQGALECGKVIHTYMLAAFPDDKSISSFTAISKNACGT